VTTFTTELPTTRPLDPSKRVKYTAGLVLGVDEFTQEQTYLAARDHWLARSLAGCGTVSGLKVSSRMDGSSPMILVSAGAAIDPAGRPVCVRTTQCANLEAWVGANTEDIKRVVSQPPAPLSVYVVLRYRDCDADWVPVPGGPCRTQDDSRAPSRLLDSYELALTLRRPEQLEEDAIRRFEAILAAIEIATGGGPFATDDDVAAAVRGLQGPVVSPPPASPTLRFEKAAADARMRTLYRTWVTEVRSSIDPYGEGGCVEPRERWLLLARVDLKLTAGFGIDGAVTIDEGDRPILVPARALREGR
jgi:hypothetical protein